MRALLVGVALLVPLFAQNPPPASNSPLIANDEFDLQAGSGWIDTAIDLQPGDGVHVDASGLLRYSNAKQFNGPEGLPRAFKDVVRDLPFNDTGRGALLGRIGSSEADRSFLIGPELDKKAPIAGRLFLGINERSRDRATGSFHVTIVHTYAPSVTDAPPVHLPEFPQSVLDSLPLRVTGRSGGLGDRVNFILIGSNTQMQAMLKTAGWVQVDSSSKAAFVDVFRDSISKEAYVTLPMSELRLFGRPQDFGYAQGDPIRVVASRHHFRLWRAPFQVEGQDVWVGAGTHDIGFSRNHRDELLTHKIDPDTDNERDYIRDSLIQTGTVLETVYVTPTNPVTIGKTATGEEFYSDGRTLLLYLAPASSN
jgi:LssY C-terminus